MKHEEEQNRSEDNCAQLMRSQLIRRNNYFVKEHLGHTKDMTQSSNNRYLLNLTRKRLVLLPRSRSKFKNNLQHLAFGYSQSNKNVSINLILTLFVFLFSVSVELQLLGETTVQWMYKNLF